MGVVDVVAGILRRADGQVYLARRRAGGEHGGRWEFPGGKCEAGETPRAALARELAEELGIEVIDSAPLLSVPWPLEQPRIRLLGRVVSAWRGEPVAAGHAAAGWWSPEALPWVEMPPADRPLAAALRLPRLAAISPPDLPDAASAARALERQLLHGLRLLQLRLPADRDLQRRCARPWNERCRAAGVPLVLNDDIATAAALPDAGVHLSEASLRRRHERPLPWPRLVGASCHDRSALEHARAIGCDYALLGPVAATASHPGRSGIGWAAFADLVADLGLPVYALGGLTPADVPQARAHGAWGVAGIRGFGWT